MIASETAAEAPLAFEYELDAAPEKVWRTLTVPELVEAWLMPNTMGKSERGEQFTLDGARHGLGRKIDCELLDVTPHQRLSYSWREAGEVPTVVTFELAPNSIGGTRLRIVHAPLTTALRAANSNAPPLALAA